MFYKTECTSEDLNSLVLAQASMENANELASSSSIYQSEYIVSIVEPQVLPGGDHEIERCQKVTEVFGTKNDHSACLEGQYCVTQYTPQ